MSRIFTTVIITLGIYGCAVSIDDGPIWEVTCKIPNQHDKGSCVNRSDCPAYKELINGHPYSIEKLSFIKRLQCTSSETSNSVCCPEDGVYRSPAISVNYINKKVRTGNMDLGLGTRMTTDDDDECGIQVLTPKLRGGELAEIDEFPWMALLLYENPITKKNEHGCGGALINRKFVLTAAHCVSGTDYSRKGPLKYISMGEYNLFTDPDCIQEVDGYDCTDGVQNIDPKRVIVYPSYNPNSSNKENDIALIELAKEVEYTDFIRPICLPKTHFNDGLVPGSLLFVSGWGRTNYFATRTDIPSPIKLKLTLPFFDHDKCAKIFQPQKLVLSDNQACAGGRKAQDSCPGDSGSPLMYLDMKNAKWVISGIVSLGLRECGTEGWPGVYTNVRQYMNWIVDNSEY